MAPHKYYSLNDTVTFWFCANDTLGSGNDGASPLYDVDLASGAAGDAPVHSGSPALLSNVSNPSGWHKISFVASVANGFAVGNEYGVACTLLADSQNPTGFVGSFKLGNTELASVPTTVSSQDEMIQWLFEYFRNKKIISSTTETLMKEDASTPLGTASVNKTTGPDLYTKGEMN